MRNRYILYFILFLYAQSAFAQYYDTGQDPASLKWMQIKTGKFTVIYPKVYQKEAFKYARSLDEAYLKITTLFPEKKIRMPVVLHNYTIQSNGYVAWAPKRMELYPTPEEDGIPLAPEEQLAVHELTHVFQMESLNQGFSKWMTVLFGQQFTGIIASFIPSWLLEGDAVFDESALTQSGRGRTPAFQKQLKALLVDTKNPYKYDKILNGSFKDFVPDDYATGYQMATWALSRNGLNLWNKVFDYTAGLPFTLNPVNFSLSRNAGLRKRTLWNETSDTLKIIWTKDISQSNVKGYDELNPDKKGKYINYYSPLYISDDSIIAVKTSLSDPASFVLINPKLKTEKKLHTPGQLYPFFISYGNGKLIWVETFVDARWENREFSDIKIMDLKSRKVSKLTRKERYMAAAISPDGAQVVALENTVTNINSLVLIDAASGNIKETIAVPGNSFLQHPQWAEGGKQITFVCLADKGEGIMSFNPGNHEWKTLIQPGRDDLQSSFLRNDSLYFVSSRSGTDNIYVESPDKQISALTHSKFGTVDVSYGGNKIYFGNYTVHGNEISTTKSGPASLSAEEKVSRSSFLINRFNLKTSLFPDSGSYRYKPEPYRKWQHLFRFHSWMPFYADIQELKADPTSIRPGITLLTQNTLSTLTATLGYEYSEDKRNVVHSRITWAGIYPEIESQLDYGTLPSIHKLSEDVANPSSITPGLNFLNTISLPLQFNTGRFSQFLRPSVSVNYVNQYIYIKDKNTYDYGQTIITGRLYFTNYYVSALRDIYPRWAQIIDFNYCFAPFDKSIYGSAVSLNTAFYFPGLFPNHSIRLRLETEKQEIEKYLYSNFISLPRGYENLIAKELNFLSVDYALPLAYPDFNIASLLYIKRIRTSLFYDYAEGPGNALYKETSKGLVPAYNSSEIESIKSFGFELLADFHVLRIPYMISAGIQSAWKNLNDSPTIGVLFNINLYGMTFGRKKV